MLNLDTHILLFAVLGTLTKQEEAILARDQWGISAIVLWEIAKLYQKRRTTLALDNPKLVEALGRIEIWPVTLDVCAHIATLDFQSDPADELIAATSLAYEAPLVTRDRRIRTSKLVPLAGGKTPPPC